MDNKTVGLILIAGGFYFWRQQQQVQQRQVQQARQPLGAGTMPPTVGTGTSQMIGGLLGSLLAKNIGGTATGAPAERYTPPYFEEYVVQNDVSAADPSQSYDPTFTDYAYN